VISDFRHLFLLIICSLATLFFISFAHGAEKGDQLYMGNCAKCHGREGEGFLRLYPPIHNSNFFKKNVSQLPCIMRYGLRGKIIVEGIEFNQIMPGNERLAPEDMRHIISFLQKRWNHPASEISVTEWLNNCNLN
jgi:cytochrome c